MAEHVDETRGFSPKVSWPAAAMAGATILAAFLTGVTPDMLEAIDPWDGPLFMAIGATIGILTGWRKRDPLRERGSVGPVAEDTMN